MPRFTVVVSAVDESTWERAMSLLAAKFPEIEPLGRAAMSWGRERWACRAPAVSHVRRWCADAQVAVVEVLETVGEPPLA